MSTTPEGKVKDKIKAVLAKYDCYYFMPVQTGYGASGLDFHCLLPIENAAIAFFVEAKALGEVPTQRQDLLIEHLKRKKAVVFVVDGDATLMGLTRWLERMQEFKLVNEDGYTFHVSVP